MDQTFFLVNLCFENIPKILNVEYTVLNVVLLLFYKTKIVFQNFSNIEID